MNEYDTGWGKKKTETPEAYRLPQHLGLTLKLANGVEGTLRNFTAADDPERYSDEARKDIAAFNRRMGISSLPIPELQIAFSSMQTPPMRDKPSRQPLRDTRLRLNESFVQWVDENGSARLQYKDLFQVLLAAAELHDPKPFDFPYVPPVLTVILGNGIRAEIDAGKEEELTSLKILFFEPSGSLIPPATIRTGSSSVADDAAVVEPQNLAKILGAAARMPIKQDRSAATGIAPRR